MRAEKPARLPVRLLLSRSGFSARPALPFAFRKRQEAFSETSVRATSLPVYAAQRKGDACSGQLHISFAWIAEMCSAPFARQAAVKPVRPDKKARKKGSMRRLRRRSIRVEDGEAKAGHHAEGVDPKKEITDVLQSRPHSRFPQTQRCNFFFCARVSPRLVFRHAACEGATITPSRRYECWHRRKNKQEEKKK